MVCASPGLNPAQRRNDSQRIRHRQCKRKGGMLHFYTMFPSAKDGVFFITQIAIYTFAWIIVTMVTAAPWLAGYLNSAQRMGKSLHLQQEKLTPCTRNAAICYWLSFVPSKRWRIRLKDLFTDGTQCSEYLLFRSELLKQWCKLSFENERIADGLTSDAQYGAKKSFTVSRLNSGTTCKHF